MTNVVLVVGIFVVPTLLLWAGLRLRRRSLRWRRAFWGALSGHVAALLVGTVAAMTPPEAWGPADFWRGLLGLWVFVLAPAVGAVAGRVTVRGRT